MKNLLSLAFLMAVVFASCKKDKEAGIQGLWNMESITFKYYVNNTLDDTDTEVLTGASMNFKEDGTVTISMYGSTESSTYSVNGNQVTFDGTTFLMQNLTDNSVTLYYKETFSPGEYDETYVQLTR